MCAAALRVGNPTGQVVVKSFYNNDMS